MVTLWASFKESNMRMADVKKTGTPWRALVSGTGDTFRVHLVFEEKKNEWFVTFKHTFFGGKCTLINESDLIE